VATPTGQQLTLGAALAFPPALVPGAIAGIIESKPIRNLLIQRRAAKSAAKIASIDAKLQAKIYELGLGGALATGAVVSTQEQE